MLLHGFLDTWRTWDLVLPALARRHDVLALTLAGHAGGPAFEGDMSESALPDAVERAMDAAGLERAHIAGNSLGGYVALQLAARGRADSVVAFAPAGGWNDDSYLATLDLQAELAEQARIWRHTPTRSSRRPRAGDAPRSSSRRTTSTSRPTCWPTSCAAC